MISGRLENPDSNQTVVLVSTEFLLYMLGGFCVFAISRVGTRLYQRAYLGTKTSSPFSILTSLTLSGSFN